MAMSVPVGIPESPGGADAGANAGAVAAPPDAESPPAAPAPATASLVDGEDGVGGPAPLEGGDEGWEPAGGEAASDKKWDLSTPEVARVCEAALDKEGHFRNQDAGDGLDRNRQMMLWVNDDFMRTQVGRDIPLGEDEMGRKLLRQEISIRHFGGRGAESEDALHAEIVKFAQGRKDRGALEGDLVLRARKATLLGSMDPGRSVAAAWPVFRDEARRHPGYRQEDEPELFAKWNATLVGTRQSLGGLVPQLSRVWKILQPVRTDGSGQPFVGPPAPARPFVGPPGPGQMVSDFTMPEDTATNAAPAVSGTDAFASAAATAREIYRGLPADQREAFTDGIGLMAMSLPPDKREGFVKRLHEDSGVKSGLLRAYGRMKSPDEAPSPYLTPDPARSAADWQILSDAHSQKGAFGEDMRTEMDYARNHSTAASFAGAFTTPDGSAPKFRSGSPEHNARVAFWERTRGKKAADGMAAADGSGTYKTPTPSTLPAAKQRADFDSYWQPLLTNPRLTPAQREETIMARDLARVRMESQIAYRAAGPFQRNALRRQMEWGAVSFEIFRRDQTLAWKNPRERAGFIKDFLTRVDAPLLKAGEEEAAVFKIAERRQRGADIVGKHASFSAMDSDLTGVAYKGTDVFYHIVGGLGGALKESLTGKLDSRQNLGHELKGPGLEQIKQGLRTRIKAYEETLLRPVVNIYPMGQRNPGPPPPDPNAMTRYMLAADRDALQQLVKLEGELAKEGFTPEEAGHAIFDNARMTAWTKDEQEDYARVLSTGEVTFNPSRVYGDVAAMYRKIDSLDITPAARERARANLDRLREEQAGKTLQLLANQDDNFLRDEFETIRRQKEREGITDPVGLVDAYQQHMKDRWWTTKAGDATLTGLVDAGRGLNRQAISVANASATLFARATDAVGMDGVAAGTRGNIATMAGWQQASLNKSNDENHIASLSGINGGYGVVKDLANTGGQLAPTILVGFATAGSSVPVQLIGTGIVGGMQGFGSAVDIAISLEQQKLGRDLSGDELQKLVSSREVMLTAGLNALQTAAGNLIFRGGAGGAGAAAGRELTLRELSGILRTQAGRAAFGREFRGSFNALLNTTKAGFMDEAREELANQVLEDIITHIGLGRELDPEETLTGWVGSYVLGGTVGGAVPHFHNPTRVLTTRLGEVNRAIEETSDPEKLANLRAGKAALEKEWATRTGTPSPFQGGTSPAPDPESAVDDDFSAAVSRIGVDDALATGAPAATRVPVAEPFPSSPAVPGPGADVVSITREKQTLDKLHGDLTRGGLPPSIASERIYTWAPIVNVPQQTMDHLRSSGLGGALPNLERTLGGLPGKIAQDILRDNTPSAGRVGGMDTTTVPSVSMDTANLVVSKPSEESKTSVHTETSTDTRTSEPDAPATVTSPTRAVQEISTALSQDLPHIRWGGKGGALDGHWSRSSGVLSRLLPLTIIGHAGGTKASQRINAFTTASDTDLAAIGATPESITRFRQSQLTGKGASARALATLIDTLDPNSASARAAVIDLENRAAASRRAAAELQSNGGLPRVMAQDGGWTVYDSATGQEIGRATTPEGAAAIVDGLHRLQPVEIGEVHDGGSSEEDRPVAKRLSKIRKKEGISKYEQWNAIAWKIYRSVSRHAAIIPYDLGVKSKNRKGVDRSAILFDEECPLTPEELEILPSPREIVLVHTAEGRLHTTNLGKRGTAVIPDDTPAGSIITHNHPSGSGPSVEDIEIALENPSFVMRVITRNAGGKVEIWKFSAMGEIGTVQIKVITEYYIGMRDKYGGKNIHGNEKALDLTMLRFPGKLKIINRIHQ
ncbi:hypothetical protein GCM10023212_14760 [Luteolibacter yonseiensis]